MKRVIMTLAAVSAAAVMAPAANATTYNITLLSANQNFDNDPGVFCATAGVQCTMNDTFNITLGAALVGQGYTTIGASITSGPSQVGQPGDVTFTSISLNGTPGSVGSINGGVTDTGTVGPTGLASPSNTLNVSFNAVTSATNPAKYGGTITLFKPASAVPEPATWALMLLGFGSIGYAMRRRPTTRLAQAV